MPAGAAVFAPLAPAADLAAPEAGLVDLAAAAAATYKININYRQHTKFWVASKRPQKNHTLFPVFTAEKLKSPGRIIFVF